MKRFLQSAVLAALLPAHGAPALACSVCFGDPGSAMSKGAVAGVLFLGGVTVFVLGSVAAAIFVCVRRARNLAGKKPQTFQS